MDWRVKRQTQLTRVTEDLKCWEAWKKYLARQNYELNFFGKFLSDQVQAAAWLSHICPYNCFRWLGLYIFNWDNRLLCRLCSLYKVSDASSRLLFFWGPFRHHKVYPKIRFSEDSLDELKEIKRSYVMSVGTSDEVTLPPETDSLFQKCQKCVPLFTFPRQLHFLLPKLKSCSTATFENSCRCTVLDTPEWRETTQQMDWRAKRPTQLTRVTEDLKCWGAWDTTCGHKAKDITPSIAWKREAWKEEANEVI